MKKLAFSLLVLGAMVSLSNNVFAKAPYDPFDYINQMNIISNSVDYYNWAQAKPQYRRLIGLCQSIKDKYPNLRSSADECITGASSIISGSVCSSHCDSPKIRHTYGPLIDRGNRELNLASQVLSYQR